MSYSYTLTESTTFTVTHARHIASKVATDLKRIQRFYGKPTDSDIADYEAEITALLKNGYLATVTYGFKRGDDWVAPTIRYSAKDLADEATTDDDPGRIALGANVDNASFYSYLTYSAAWDKLSNDEQTAFKKTLPFFRGGAPEPGINGYLSHDRTYSSGGRSLERASIRS